VGRGLRKRIAVEERAGALSDGGGDGELEVVDCRVVSDGINFDRKRS
jgi:hypothetical protein